MSQSTRDDIHGWITELLADVTEQGALSIIGLVHHDGRGADNSIFAMKAGAGKWNDIDAMTDAFFRVATRHARGLIGAQQFCLNAIFGTSGEPTRFLPFGIMGALQFGAVPGGANSEAPTVIGAQSQGMRLTEMIVQGSFAQNAHIMGQLTAVLDRLMNRMDIMEKRGDEQWIALKNVLVELQQNAASMAMKGLQYELGKKAVALLPGIANMMAGRDVFPQAQVDASIADAVTETLSPEQQQYILQLVASQPNGEMLSGILADQFLKARQRKESMKNEGVKLTATAVGGYDRGETDAMGDALRVLRQPLPATIPVKELSAKNDSPIKNDSPNGVTSNGGNGHASVATVSDTNTDETLLRDLITEMPQLEMALGMVAKENPVLAERLQKRIDAIKAGQK